MENSNERFQDLFVEACNDAIQDFRTKDSVYRAAVKRRSELSGTIRFIWESGDALALTAEQRRLLAEYYALLNGDKELEVYVACYERGMRDCLSLLARLGLVSNVE